MKKIILFLLFGVITLNIANANESKTLNNPYLQTHITESIFTNVINYHSNWLKKDSIQIFFDFIDNNRIIITENNTSIYYKVKSKKMIKFDEANQYDIKAVDSKNIKHDIQIIYYNNNITLLIIVNERNIERYLFANNLDKKSDYKL